MTKKLILPVLALLFATLCTTTSSAQTCSGFTGVNVKYMGVGSSAQFNTFAFAAEALIRVCRREPPCFLLAQRSNRASVRTFCQRGASPRRMEPYHAKPRVTASFNCGPGGVRARTAGDGVGSNRRRMRSP